MSKDLKYLIELYNIYNTRPDPGIKLIFKYINIKNTAKILSAKWVTGKAAI